MKVDPNRHEYAIICNPECGPTFGADIYIADNANTTMDSFSNLGCTYSHPQYAFETEEAKTVSKRKGYKILIYGSGFIKTKDILVKFSYQDKI